MNYPNADTSPERFKQLMEGCGWLLTVPRGLNTDERAICDLLAMVLEREAMLKDENIPRSYRSIPGTSSPLYCLWGTSSITYADELEKVIRDRGRTSAEASCPHGHNRSTCCWCNPSLPDPIS